MAWTPRYKVLSLREIANNLVTYWKANQEEVFVWLGDSELPLIKEFTDSLNEDNTGWPAVALNNDVDAQDFVSKGTEINAGYQPSFALMVVGPDPNECVRQARLYTLGLSSMMVNCPPETLLANTGANLKEAVVEDITASFLEMMISEDKVDYMQRVDIQATIRVKGSIYTEG